MIPIAGLRGKEDRSAGLSRHRRDSVCRGQSLLFAATIETAPEFQLPEYKGLPVKREAKEVSDADVAKALEMLREQRADFAKVERPLANGDIAVVNYSGTSEGKPLTEIAPTAKGLTAQQGFWVEMKPDSFVPGFSEQLLGAKAGDKRTVNVDFPGGFREQGISRTQGRLRSGSSSKRARRHCPRWMMPCQDLKLRVSTNPRRVRRDPRKAS